MIRIIANNVEKFLKKWIHGDISVSVYKGKYIVVDIIKGDIFFHHIEFNIYDFGTYDYISLYVAKNVYNEYKRRINNLYFK